MNFPIFDSRYIPNEQIYIFINKCNKLFEEHDLNYKKSLSQYYNIFNIKKQKYYKKINQIIEINQDIDISIKNKIDLQKENYIKQI
jgi:hypothetical protein